MYSNVKGTGFTWGSQLTFYDASGKELAAIKQTEVATLYPKYEVTKDGKPWAECKKENKLGASKKEMTLDIPGNNDYKITGDRLAWHLEITRTETGKKAGEVHKKYGIRDNYTVKVEDGESDLDILLCAILIDQVYHDRDE
mmetsp:Transcript_13428/g.18766  ORF Transcript_13428/g.18766 Transcript_13428/m.18766 type:complete len:141 (+) Transcript_13428:281-703(+)